MLLVPPNRISDRGFVLTSIDRGGGAVGLTLEGFFDSQISGYVGIYVRARAVFVFPAKEA